MKFSIGDVVLLKHTGAEGRVIRIINNEMLEVEVGGTHFPVFIDEMEHPYLKWFMEKRQVPGRKTLPLQETEADPSVTHVSPGFYLSFLPVFRFDEMEDIVDKLKVYLLNQTHYEVAIQYECHTRSGILFTHKALLHPFSHFYLHDIPFELMNEQPRFSYILEQQLSSEKRQIRDSLRIRPRKLFEYISILQKENKPMFSVLLAKDFPDQKPHIPILPVRKPDKPVVPKPVHKRTPIMEIDLHAEALNISTKSMDNYEILHRQLNKLESALNTAIQLRQESMVVIHGVGKGKLKEEVHALLRSYSGVDFFLHQWSPKYGYGATQIFFR